MAEVDDTPTVIITKPGVLAFGEGLPVGSNITTFFQDETVIQVSCGQDHSAVVCESGRVYTFGENRYNEQMEYDVDTISGPRLVDTLSKVKITQAACGYQYTLFLSDTGKLYSCGKNDDGQLGLGHPHKVHTPVLVTGLPPIEKVAAGSYHTVVLTNSGEVWGCGDNIRGQLGLGDSYNLVCFTRVPNLPEPIVVISCGRYHTALITASRVLLVTGTNICGQLGFRGVNKLTSFKPVPAPSTAFAAVSCGSHHTIALRVDGTTWAWGDNDCGQLGPGFKCGVSTATEVVGLEGQNVSQVIAEYDHSAMLTQEGDVWVWGEGTCGELGLEQQDLLTPTMLTKSPGLVVRQVAFAQTYSLLLVVPSSTKTSASQLQIGASEEDDAVLLLNNLEQSIMRSLECPVCNEIMCAPIHQCAKGHSLCAACRSGLVCPLCLDRMFEARNFALEGLSEDICLPCSECLRRMPASEFARHRQVCPGRSYGCPVGERCGWMGRPPAMLAHATQAHAGNTWPRLPHMFVQTATADVLLAAHGQVFTLHRRYEAGERFRAAVRYIGPPENARNYQLELAVMTDRMNINYHRNVSSDIENLEDIFQSSNCVTMESDVVKTFLQRGRLLCRVAILEAGTGDYAEQMKAFRSLHDEAAKTDDNN